MFKAIVIVTAIGDFMFVGSHATKLVTLLNGVIHATRPGKRKQKSYGQKTAENQLRKNDKILEKYYNLFEKEVAIVFSLNLISDGFDHSFFIGHESKEGLIYNKSYNYLFHEYELDGRKLTQIIKQKTKVYVKR